MKLKSLLAVATTLSLFTAMCSTVASAATNGTSVPLTITGSNPVRGKTPINVNIEKYTDEKTTKYRMRDMERHIWISGDDAINDYSLIVGLNPTKTEMQSDPNYLGKHCLANLRINAASATNKTFTQNCTSSWPNVALGVLNQVADAYDYYDIEFDWQGTDGNNAELFVNPYDRTGTYASCDLNYIAFGKSFSFDSNGNLLYDSQGKPVYEYHAKDFDAVVHEYTHRVTANKVKWAASNQDSETACLNEAYSDIMAEYADSMDWKSLAGTTRNVTVKPKNGKYTFDDVVHYFDFNTYSKDKKTKSIDCHAGSTILTCAAYLMDKKYNIPDSMAEDMWFTSMNNLTKGANKATFANCRGAVINALETVLKQYTSTSSAQKDKYRVAVRTAFNAVGVYGSHKLGDVNNDSKVDNKDVTLVQQYIAGLTSFDVERRSLADVNFDGTISVSDAITLYNLM